MTKKTNARGLIILLVAICSTAIAFAQEKWSRTHGGLGVDVGHSVQQTADGGYIVAGWTESFGAGSRDVYLIKTNAQGDTLWTSTCGGTDYDYGNSVRQTADGGYVVVGYTKSFDAGGGDGYLFKTSASGDTLWTRTYGGTGYDEGNSIQQTTDGGYIIAGETQSFGAGHADVYLIKTSAQGDTLWTRAFGGVDYDYGSSVQQTTDGGYIIAGVTCLSGTNYDAYVIKTNAQGDTLWTQIHGGTSYDCGSSVQQTTDGGYIIAGWTESFGAGSRDVYLIKTNAQGETLWTRTYGGTDDDRGFSVQQTSDGGYVIAGYTYSFGAGTPGCDNVYLIKTDASGDTLWTGTYGGTNDEGCSSVQQTTDGGYIIAGYTTSFGAGDADVYLIKTDANGNVGVEEPATRHPANPTRFLVQPNPFTSFARVPWHETEVFVLSDVTGRQVAVCRGDRIGEGLRPGVYFLSPVGLRSSRAVTATIIKAAF